MVKKIKRNKPNLKDVSDDTKKQHISKNKKQKGKDENNQKLGIVKDKSIKFKNKLHKNAQKFSNKLKQIHKNEGNLVSSDVVKVQTVKSKGENKKSNNSIKNQKKQQKNKVAETDISNKEQRKKSDYSNNTKKKQEKLDAAKIMKVKNKGEIKKSDNSTKSTKTQLKLNMNKNKEMKHAYDQSPDLFNKKNSAAKKSMKKRNNHSMPDANEIQDSKFTKQKKKKKQNADDETTKLKTILQKKKKQEKRVQSPRSALKTSDNSQPLTKRHNLDVKKLEEMLVVKRRQTKKEKENANAQPLRERMMTKLRASRFRFLNETLYNNESSESKKYFKEDPDAFTAYHDGYKQQVEQWPLNPLNIIISSIKKMPKDHIIADFGCGEARLAASVTHKVHSFDFVSLNDNVTVCDMAHTPLLTNGVHVVVFCLSLMGTNLKDYIVEANRVLKKDGILKIAEVESRFERVEDFIKLLSEYGFKNTWKDLSHNLFYFLDFKKEKDIGNKKNKLPAITLKPCLYKKR